MKCDRETVDILFTQVHLGAKISPRVTPELRDANFTT